MLVAERFRLAVRFNYDENWIGGAYYVRNIICALGLLPDAERPDVILIADGLESFKFIESTTHYPRLSWLTLPQLLSLRGTLDVDAVFPHIIPSLENKTVTWIPDFQDKHLKEFFPEDDLKSRTDWHEASFKAAAIIFSSRSVLRDFHRYYPNRNIKPFVVRFATFNDFAEPPGPAFRAKHRLPPRYFYAPNQFWAHKNHTVVLEALRLLKQRGILPFICFSGKEYDYRAPGYFDSLLQKIREWGLEEQVSMLGFLPRGQQLSVIRGAHSIIQPSLFEGWSTVVEDAKSAGIFVIASDIPVHREQLAKNGDFFEPRNPADLARLMEHYWLETPTLDPVDYQSNQLRFAEDFVQALKYISAYGKPPTAKLHNPYAVSRLESRLLTLQTANNSLASGRQESHPGQLKPHALQTGVTYAGGPMLADHLVLHGFSNAEEGGIWSVSTDAMIEGVVAEGIQERARSLRISCSVANPTSSERWFEVSLPNGGPPVRRYVTQWSEFDVELSFPVNVNVLLTVHVKTNFLAQAGPEDRRHIGVLLRSLTIVPISADADVRH